MQALYPPGNQLHPVQVADALLQLENKGQLSAGLLVQGKVAPKAQPAVADEAVKLQGDAVSFTRLRISRRAGRQRRSAWPYNSPLSFSAARTKAAPLPWCASGRHRSLTTRTGAGLSACSVMRRIQRVSLSRGIWQNQRQRPLPALVGEG